MRIPDKMKQQFLKDKRYRGLIIILSSPSGAGKSSLTRALLKIDNNLRLSISATTRMPRPKEVEGVSYYFKTKPEFEELIKQNMFLEYAKIYDNYYGTLKKYVDDLLDQGLDVLFDIDWQGARSIKQATASFRKLDTREFLRTRLCSRTFVRCADSSLNSSCLKLSEFSCTSKVISIFILPPSLEVLEQRLRNRAADNEEVIKLRMQSAASEIEHAKEYDYIITNDDFDVTVEKIHSIIVTEKAK